MEIPSIVVLIGICVFGGAAVLATTYYPVAKAREDHASLAKDAKDIIDPEVASNIALVAVLRNKLDNNWISPERFDVSGWETISRGGLLLGLDAVEIRRYLKMYRLTYTANVRLDALSESSTGVASVMTTFAAIQSARIGAVRQVLDQIDEAAKEFQSNAPKA